MTAELGIFNGHLPQHLLAALWFLFCWVGYTRYATRIAAKLYWRMHQLKVKKA